MYKPKPEQRNTNRLRLDIEPKLPNLMVIESQLHEAKGRRGTLIELPWQGLKTLQMWTLSVQWDLSADLPLWTLTELYSGETKVHWANPYGQTELPMMYDVICMSIYPPEPKPRAPEVVAPPPPPPPAPEPPPPPPPPPQQQQMAPMPYPMYPPMPGYDPNMMMPQYYPPMDPNQPPPPYGYPYPYPPPGQPWPYANQPYPMPPGQPPMQGPMPGQPPMPGQQGMPGQNAPPNYPPPSPGQLVPTPFGPAPLDAGPEKQAPAKLKTDYSLVSKRNRIQLGTLLLESTLISDTTLEAALKVQELVEEGLISLELAPRALFGFHDKGQAIGEYLPDFESIKLPPSKVSLQAQKNRPKTSAEMKPAYDLLQKAGVLTENDLKVAMGVRQKHGGELLQILEAAKKLDRKTLDAAIICLPIIREGLMRLEQCIIALNYCSRSRVDFDTALDEMGWPNPRKLRKDLPL